MVKCQDQAIQTDACKYCKGLHGLLHIVSADWTHHLLVLFINVGV